MTLQELIATYQVCDTSPTLLASVQNFIGRDIKDFVDPTDAVRANTRALVLALVAKDAAAIKAATDKMGLQCFRLDNNQWQVFYRHRDISQFPIVLYWNFAQDALQVVIEDPHNKHDLVFRCTTRLVGNNDFWRPWVMISNAAAVDCGKGQAAGQPNRSNSDCAHAWQCLFRLISTWIYQQAPTIPHIQLHGMVGSDNTNLLIHNQFGVQFTTKYKSICAEMAYALAEIFPLTETNKMVLATHNLKGVKDGLPYVVDNYAPGKAWFRSPLKGINTCVEARAINGGGAWSVGDEDKGLFAHIELRTARFGMENNTDRMDRLYKAIGLAVNNFMASKSLAPAVSSINDES